MQTIANRHTRFIIVFILPVMALMLSGCAGRSRPVSAPSGTDSIQPMSTDFLADMGIGLLSAGGSDTLRPLHSTDMMLSESQSGRLLSGVTASTYSHNATSAKPSAFIISARRINDDVILCQFATTYSDIEDIYVATFSNNGHLIDAMFTGHEWDNSDLMDPVETDSTELVSSTTARIIFTSQDQFRLTRTYTETSVNPNTDSSTIKFISETTARYKIRPSGQISLADFNREENGNFKTWIDGKSEWDIYETMEELLQYPYSDTSVLDRWNSLGVAVDGATTEAFCEYFYRYVYLPYPERVLEWIYRHRDIKSLTLTMPIGDRYISDSDARSAIDSAIDKLSDGNMKSYFKDLTSLWKSDNA